MTFNDRMNNEAMCAVSDLLKKRKRSGQAKTEDMEIYDVLCGKDRKGKYTTMAVFYGMAHLKRNPKSNVKATVENGKRYFEYTGELEKQESIDH